MQGTTTQSNDGDGESFETNVYRDGVEVCIRARSQHSRAKHAPKTDDGSIVFEDGEPVPKCELEPNTDTEWVVRSVTSCVNRDACARCGDEETISDKAEANGGKVSWARKMRYGDDWGSSGNESSSDNRSQSAGD